MMGILYFVCILAQHRLNVSIRRGFGWLAKLNVGAFISTMSSVPTGRSVVPLISKIVPL